jgi:hypothetical protein
VASETLIFDSNIDMKEGKKGNEVRNGGSGKKNEIIRT